MTKSFIQIGVLILGLAMIGIGLYAETHMHGGQPSGDVDYWSQLNASMDTMHVAMGATERSGNADVDFVRLMVPHHQGAIDMAKVQLLQGRDPQMRRLAQEIVTEQQLEIELMLRWLKAHPPDVSHDNSRPAAATRKDN
jgi:uncharacterized protein (DUF305 family)